MNRIDRSIEKYKQLFGDGVPATHVTDPDFQDILSHFIFGEVFYQGELDYKERELITLVVLATNQTLPQLIAHVSAALSVGLTPVEIKEAVYQCAPYIGFPKTLNAIDKVKADKYGVSVAQLCLRYDIQLGLAVIPKTANPDRMRINAELDFVISDANMEILKNVEPIQDYGEHSYFPVFGGKLK
ncbi:carboxymuconolactone decarboxylase family protein [Priestia sp. P5]|uniref:carboxymuconolactone decarboxylase family protein n=1 Tax=Priestia sp. P5 TaxID=2917806 RepID=UPI002405344C|nr:carboxymuconolactone decarboxylase family protein [Priestia sp. P5]MDG0058187.1 carboxymuconolactone decarboxylase family protein [Priestia sp. P5]